MRFTMDDIERIEDAQLILLGVQPSEVARMPDWQKWDVLNMWEAMESLKHGKLPGQK